MRVLERAQSLQHALAAESAWDVAAAAHDLAGLGEGSTPAGDDYLVGAMYALRALLPAERAAALCTAIAGAAGPRTTRRSALWLQRAAGGEAISTWSVFLSALASGSEDALRANVAAVLQLGHTSGRAALAGFVAVLDTLAQGDRP